MNKQNLIITKFENILYSSDKKGHVITMQSRYASCFIITLKGKIHFSFNGFCITTDSKQAIFIPKGCAYKNECLEDAESIVVNFEASQAPFAPCPLQPLDATTALRFYNNINRCVLESGTASQFYLLSELYLMAHQLFRQNTQKSNKDITAEKAIFFINNEFTNSALQIEQVAKHCNVSAVYLRKITKEKFNKTPFEILTDARMKKAMILLLEGHQIKEIAILVGYSDIYQFSRAFKRYYGFSPSAKME